MSQRLQREIERVQGEIKKIKYYENELFELMLIRKIEPSEMRGYIRRILEAIKNNNKINSIFFETVNIDDEGVELIANFIRENPTRIEGLGLQDCKIGNRGAIALAEVLKENASLTTLMLDKNNIGLEGGIALAEALKMNSTLESLTLNGNESLDNTKIAAELGHGLKQNSTLEKLYLAGNNIDEEGIKILKQALIANPIEQREVLVNDEWLSEDQLVQQQVLPSINKQQQREIQRVQGEIKAVQEGWYPDNVFSLSDFPTITPSKIQAYIRRLLNAIKNYKKINTIAFEIVNLEDDGVELIANFIRENPTRIEALGLQDCKIGNRGAIALAEVLKSNKTLHYLMLDKNNIGLEGGIALAEALKMNSTLQLLSLNGNESPDNTKLAAALAYGIKQNSTLEYLYLAGNNIDGEVINILKQALNANPTVQREVVVNDEWLVRKQSQQEEQKSQQVRIQEYQKAYNQWVRKQEQRLRVGQEKRQFLSSARNYAQMLEQQRLAQKQAQRLRKQAQQRLARQAQQKQAQRLKKQEQRLARQAEQKQAQRLAKQEQQRLAKQEQQRLAKQEQQRLAKQEQQRLAKQEQQRLAKQEQQRLAKQEQQRLAKQEQQRLAKQEQQRLAKQEQQRLAKQEQQRLAKQEQQRLARQQAQRVGKQAEQVEQTRKQTQRRQIRTLLNDLRKLNPKYYWQGFGIGKKGYAPTLPIAEDVLFELSKRKLSADNILQIDSILQNKTEKNAIFRGIGRATAFGSKYPTFESFLNSQKQKQLRQQM